MNDLVAAFNEYFEVICADTTELMKEVFRLRYQVLSIEKQIPGFESSNYLDGLEIDEYDERAAHCLLQHRPSGNYVGTLRLILPDPLDSEEPFPIERHTQLDTNLIDVTKLPREHTAEISRLVVLNKFPHHRTGERRRYNVNADMEKRHPEPCRRFPHPVLGLMVALIRMCAEHDIIYWYAAMDPALNRLLKLYGLNLDPIGPLTEHHGLRRPYFADLSKVLDRMYLKHHMVWELLTNYGRYWPPTLERRAMPRHIHTPLELREPILRQ